MKTEIIIFGITGFLLYNAYYDGKYTKLFVSWKKYIQMATIALVGLSLYIMIKRNPLQTKNMLLYANNMVRYMPIDRHSMDMITPIFDFTSNRGMATRGGGFMESFNTGLNPNFQFNGNVPQKGFITSGFAKPNKRSVSGLRKKYVASNQDWKCGHCGQKLNAWFEVDHKVSLEHGGGNDVANLVALCRECHGRKTVMENL